MTIFGLLQIVCTLAGVVAGVAVGVRHSWWAGILGAPAGAVVGYAVYVVVAVAIGFVAFGPKEFFRTALPEKWRRQKS